MKDVILLLVVLILLMIAILTTKNEDKIIYEIEPKHFVMQLKYLKMHLTNNLRTLNNYLQDESIDENVLVKLIERTEFQIERINDLLTHYGDINKKIKEVKRILDQ